MNGKLTTFDPANHLKSDQAIADFLLIALETEDPAYVAHAVGVVARAKGMKEIANQFVVHGLTISTPVSLKSRTLRVATARPRERAIAAICRSAGMTILPMEQRTAAM